MRNPHWPTVLLFAVTLLAGAVVGSALRAALHGSMPVQAGEPFLVTTAGR